MRRAFEDDPSGFAEAIAAISSAPSFFGSFEELSQGNSIEATSLRKGFENDPNGFARAVEAISRDPFFGKTFDLLIQKGIDPQKLREYFSVGPYNFAFTINMLHPVAAGLFRMGSDGNVDLAAGLGDKKIVFYVYEIASLNAAKGMIESFGLQPSQVAVRYQFEVNDKDLVRKYFPDSGIEINEAGSMPKPNEIAIAFHDSRNISVEAPAAFYIPYVFFKYALPEALDPKERQAMRDKMGLAPSREVWVVSSPVSREVEDILKAYAQESSSSRPLLILGMRRPDPRLKAQFNAKGYDVRERNAKDQDSRQSFNGMADGRPMGEADVIILNTQGELLPLLAVADQTIVGRDRNLMEPVSQGKVPLYFPGEFPHNREILEFLKRQGAAEEVYDLHAQIQARRQNPLVNEPTVGARKAFRETLAPANKFFAGLLIMAAVLGGEARSEARGEAQGGEAGRARADTRILEELKDRWASATRESIMSELLEAMKAETEEGVRLARQLLELTPAQRQELADWLDQDAREGAGYFTKNFVFSLILPPAFRIKLAGLAAPAFHKKTEEWEAKLEKIYTFGEMAHGVAADKGGINDLLNIILEGRIRAGENGYVDIGDLQPAGAPYDVSSARYGPFYVVLNASPKRWPANEELKLGLGAEWHKAYLVPDGEYKEYLLSALHKAKELINAKELDIPEGRIDQAVARIKTYDEFISEHKKSGPLARLAARVQMPGVWKDLERRIRIGISVASVLFLSNLLAVEFLENRGLRDFDLSQHRMTVVSGQENIRSAMASGADYVAPAGPFRDGKNGVQKPVGWVRVRGVESSSFVRVSPGTSAMLKGLILVGSDGYVTVRSAEGLDPAKFPADRFPEGFQAGPMAIVGGKVRPDLENWQKRGIFSGRKVVVGVDGAGNVHVLDLYGLDFIGVTGPTTKRLLQELGSWRGGKDIRDALFVDGGSTGPGAFQHFPVAALMAVPDTGATPRQDFYSRLILGSLATGLIFIGASSVTTAARKQRSEIRGEQGEYEKPGLVLITTKRLFRWTMVVGFSLFMGIMGTFVYLTHSSMPLLERPPSAVTAPERAFTAFDYEASWGDLNIFRTNAEALQNEPLQRVMRHYVDAVEFLRISEPTFYPGLSGKKLAERIQHLAFAAVFLPLVENPDFKSYQDNGGPAAGPFQIEAQSAVDIYHNAMEDPVGENLIRQNWSGGVPGFDAAVRKIKRRVLSTDEMKDIRRRIAEDTRLQFLLWRLYIRGRLEPSPEDVAGRPGPKNDYWIEFHKKYNTAYLGDTAKPRNEGYEADLRQGLATFLKDAAVEAFVATLMDRPMSEILGESGRPGLNALYGDLVADLRQIENVNWPLTNALRRIRDAETLWDEIEAARGKPLGIQTLQGYKKRLAVNLNNLARLGPEYHAKTNYLNQAWEAFKALEAYSNKGYRSYEWNRVKAIAADAVRHAEIARTRLTSGLNGHAKQMTSKGWPAAGRSRSEMRNLDAAKEAEAREFLATKIDIAKLETDFREIIKEYGYTGFADLCRAEGENVWYLFANGLPAVRKLFSPEEFKAYWPDLVRLGVAAGIDAGNLFTGLLAVKELFSPEEFKAYWPDLVRLGVAAGENAGALFKDGLPAVRGLITDRESLNSVGDDLVRLGVAAGQGAWYLFANGLPAVRKLFSPEEFKAYWPELDKRLLAICKLTNDYNRERVLGFVLGKFPGLLQNKGPDLLKFLDFAIEIISKENRLCLQILEGIYDGIKKHVVLKTDLETKKEMLFNFIGITHSFNPSLFGLYKQGGQAALERVFAFSREILTDGVGETELAEFEDYLRSQGVQDIDEAVVASIQISIPSSGASFVKKGEILRLYKKYRAAGDRRADVPKPLAGKDFGSDKAIPLMEYTVKEGEAFDPEGKLSGIVSLLHQKHEGLSGEAIAQAKERDRQSFKEALSDWFKAFSDREKRDKALNAFYAMARHEDALKEKVDALSGDYNTVQLLESLFTDKDNLSILVRGVLDTFSESELPVSGPSRAVANAGGLVKGLQGVWNNVRLSDAEKSAALQKMLAGISKPEIEEKIVPLVRDSALRTVILELPAAGVRVSRAQIIETLFEGPYTIIQREKSKFIAHQKGKVVLEFRVVKGIPYGLWGLQAGVCIAPDIALWNKKEFFLLAMIDKRTQKTVGFVHLFEKTIDGNTVLTVPGIEPSVEFLGEVKATDVYPQIEEALIRVAEAGGYAGLYIPTEKNVLSNRSDIAKIVMRKYDKIRTTLVNSKGKTQKVEWNTVPQPYSFSEVYTVWQNNMPSSAGEEARRSEMRAAKEIRDGDWHVTYPEVTADARLLAKNTEERSGPREAADLFVRGFLMHASPAKIAEVLSRIARQKVTMNDLTKEVSVGYYGEGVHKMVFKVVLKTRSKKDLSIKLAMKKTRKAGAISPREIKTLERISKRTDAVPVFGGLFELEGQRFYLEEFIEGETVTEIQARERGRLAPEIRQEAVNVILRAAKEIGAAPTDVNRGNVMIRDADGSAVLVDIGDQYERIGECLLNLIRCYGYYADSPLGNRFIFQTFIDVLGPVDGLGALEENLTVIEERAYSPVEKQEPTGVWHVEDWRLVDEDKEKNFRKVLDELGAFIADAKTAVASVPARSEMRLKPVALSTSPSAREEVRRSEMRQPVLSAVTGSTVMHQTVAPSVLNVPTSDVRLGFDLENVKRAELRKSSAVLTVATIAGMIFSLKTRIDELMAMGTLIRAIVKTPEAMAAERREVQPGAILPAGEFPGLVIDILEELPSMEKLDTIEAVLDRNNNQHHGLVLFAKPGEDVSKRLGAMRSEIRERLHVEVIEGGDLAQVLPRRVREIFERVQKEKAFKGPGTESFVVTGDKSRCDILGEDGLPAAVIERTEKFDPKALDTAGTAVATSFSQELLRGQKLSEKTSGAIRKAGRRYQFIPEGLAALLSKITAEIQGWLSTRQSA